MKTGRKAVPVCSVLASHCWVPDPQAGIRTTGLPGPHLLPCLCPAGTAHGELCYEPNMGVLLHVTPQFTGVTSAPTYGMGSGADMANHCPGTHSRTGVKQGTNPGQAALRLFCNFTRW